MASTTSSPLPQRESPLSSHERKPYSCMSCYDRKVKCDRRVPCSNCRKSSSECVYKPPPPPKRGKRKRLDEEDLPAKCKRYENLLRQAGIPLDSAAPGLVKFGPVPTGRPSAGTEQTPDTNGQRVKTKSPAGSDELHPPRGTLICRSSNGKRSCETRYVSSTLWTTVADQFHNPNEILEASDDEQDMEGEHEQTAVLAGTSIDTTGSGLLLNLSYIITDADMKMLHPLPHHVDVLWQSYQENVDPLVKVTHAPSMAGLLSDAQVKLSSLSKSQEALLFAIYLAAVNSMTEEECQDKFNDRRTDLLDRYRIATQHALARVKFISSPEIITLTAFLIFLLSVRQRLDHSTMWALSGVAVRIGKRFGLHRDGTELNISPYQTQLRRIIWWQIVLLDGRSGEIAGGSSASVKTNFDIIPPLNINDEDISPDMKDFPAERTGITEMVNVLLRFKMGMFRLKYDLLMWSDSTMDKRDLGDFVQKCDKAIDEFEHHLEDSVMRFIQPHIPAHFLASVTIRTGISTIRVLAHHPRQRSDNGANMPQAEKDMVFVNSLNCIEGDSLIQKTPLLQRFVWHAQNYFQWPAFLYVLGELRVRITGEEVERAWRLIEEVYEHRTALSSGSRKGLYKAVANLTLNVWTERENKLAAKDKSSRLKRCPQFITKLRSEREESISRRHSKQANSEAVPTLSTITPNDSANHEGGIPLFQDFDSPEYFNPSDWAEWDRLLQESMIEPFMPMGVEQNNYSI